MNKKLFSWKALAGLALLVAMGLTSCQQDAVVDPTDPYKPKPVEPGTSTKGGDLVFTITKTADLASLWASYDATKKADLMKKTELNIVINSGSYKLDGVVLTLPAFFNTSANSVLNLTFNGNFQDADKLPFNLDASTNLSGAKVNIKLPAQAFNMNLDATNVAATLTSDGATIGYLDADANTAKNNALTIGSGVTVNAIDVASTGAILTNGGVINALIVDANPTLVNKKGFQIGNQAVYTTNLIINAAGIVVSNNNDTPLGDIVINKGCDVTFNTIGAGINSVSGATKASECKVNLGWQQLKKIGSVKNVTLTNGGSGITVEKDAFNGVVFDEYVWIADGVTSFSNAEVTGNVGHDFTADNETFTFSNVKFATGTSLNIWGGIYVSTTPTKITYQWDIDNKVWVEVTAAAPITAANKSDAGVEVSSNDVYYNVTTSQIGAYDGNLAGKIGDHKVVTIVWANGTSVLPENCTLVFDSKCSIAGAAINDTSINGLVNNTANDPTFLTVKSGDDTYTYKKSNWGYVLIKK
jgi:hypothetical protein